MSTRSSSSGVTVLAIVILIFTFPIWIGILGGLFGLLAGLLGAGFGIVAGLFGAIFGVIGGILGGIAGLFGWIFDAGDWPVFGFFHWNWITIAILAIIVVLLSKNQQRKPKS